MKLLFTILIGLMVTGSALANTVQEAEENFAKRGENRDFA